MSTDSLDFVRQLLFLSSILGGFAVTMVIELISRGHRGRVASFATAAFILSSAVSLVTTFVFVLILTASSGAPGAAPLPTAALVSIAVPMGMLVLLGVAAFLVGVGLTGWLHSKAIGIVSTVTITISFLVIIVIMVYLARSGAG